MCACVAALCGGCPPPGIRAAVALKPHCSGCLLVKIELWWVCMHEALEVSVVNFVLCGAATVNPLLFGFFR